eukprot:gene7059-14362_t
MSVFTRLSKRRISSKLIRISAGAVSLPRLYHSYPDPNETPVISSTTSKQEKTVLKSGEDFEAMLKFSMKDVFAGVPISSGIKNTKAPQTEVSRLSNGLTIASQELPGLMSSFALIIGSGSSFETQHGDETNTGVTHLIEQSAFRSTHNRSHEQILKEIEQLGGMVQCLTSRENIMFCVDVFRQNAEHALDILADAVLHTRLTDEELEESRMIMSFQHNELPSELISRDTLQRAAYLNSPLSNHHYCPELIIPTLNEETIQKFRSNILFGENCVLSGSGIDHETLRRIAESKFSNIPSRGTASNEILKSLRKSSKYTGGLLLNTRTLKEPFSRLSLGFEIGGWHDNDLVTACVLQQLLGGGSSFSAGGPGKGMYSRLYREVLNKNHWIESAESFVSIHDESGIFGIDGSSQSGDLPGLFRVFLEQLLRLTIEQVQPIELSRAKNMLKSMLLMQLESRLVLCEDIAKQMITYKKRESSQELCDKVDKISAEDIQLLAMKMFKSDPTVACVGPELTTFPNYEQLKTFTTNYKEYVLKNKTTNVK